MRIGIMTREWPPDIYGGAGVHVEQLTAQLSRIAEVRVECFGDPRPDALAFAPPAELADANMALQTLGVDLLMADAADGLDIMHSHTWYANLAGHLAALLHGVPTSSPLIRWSRGGPGRRSSSAVATGSRRGWSAPPIEKAAAVIAVSAGMKADVLDCYPFVDPQKVHVVHNGIDTEVYQPVAATDALEAHGVSLDRPFALFVGRITWQKGLPPHLLRAAQEFDPAIRLVLCASSSDTPSWATKSPLRSLRCATRAATTRSSGSRSSCPAPK